MYARRVRVISFFFGLLFFRVGIGQEIKVRGGFMEDSLLIGQDVNFYMTAVYPPELEMIFPDNGYNFSPFEYSTKRFFPTQLIDGLAYDSTVYMLQSYEIDLVQYLQLPAIILDGSDSTILFTPLDSIYFAELAPIVSDTTQLVANLKYQRVNTVFNYPLLYYILGAIIILVVILMLLFGKRIMRYFKMRRLNKEYEKFSAQLTTFIRKLKTEPTSELAEEALSMWKRYQEKLDRFPFTKLTTKEILKDKHNRELEKPLKSIDYLIYGKKTNVTIYQDFQQIEDFSQYRYLKKVAEIRHGK